MKRAVLLGILALFDFVDRWFTLAPKPDNHTPPATTEEFHQEVQAIMHRITPFLVRAASPYSPPAAAAALMMQTLACLSVCVRNALLTREQAVHMMRQLVRLEFGDADMGPLVESFLTDQQRRTPSK
jgi:hypothetical protein